MNKKLFWFLVLLGFAVLCSLIFGDFKEEEIVEPEKVELINYTTAREELLKTREETKLSEVVVNISTNITTAGTENIEDLKDEYKNRFNFTYHYHPNNTDCFATCNPYGCDFDTSWCDENETKYIEDLLK